MSINTDASTKGSDMQPTKALPLSRVEFYMSILCICVAHSASMTSGYRTDKRNHLVGGVVNSKHRDAYAFDLVPDEPAKAEGIVEDARRLGYDAINEGDHVHIEYDPQY